MSIKATLLGISAVTVAVLVLASIYESSKQQAKVRVSNELLASFERKTVLIDPRIHAAYVGLYQVEPDFNIEITTDGQQLFAQGTNQRRVEIYPADERVFFNHHTEALITFDAPVGGKTHRFLLQQVNQIRDGKRI